MQGRKLYEPWRAAERKENKTDVRYKSRRLIHENVLEPRVSLVVHELSYTQRVFLRIVEMSDIVAITKICFLSRVKMYIPFRDGNDF